MEIGWMRLNSFFGMLIASILGVAIYNWALQQDLGAWPSPPAEKAAPRAELPVPPGPAGWVLSFLGFGALALAYFLALDSNLVGALVALVGAAVLWRGRISLAADPRLSRKWLAGIMLLIMAVGALFRFYKAGDLPAGMLDGGRAEADGAGPGNPGWKKGNLPHTGIGRKRNVLGGRRGHVAFWREYHGLPHVHADPRLHGGGPDSPAGPGAGWAADWAYWPGLSRRFGVWPVSFSRQEYLVCSSYVPILAAPWLMLWGLRRGNPLLLVLSGFFPRAEFQRLQPIPLGASFYGTHGGLPLVSPALLARVS